MNNMDKNKWMIHERKEEYQILAFLGKRKFISATYKIQKAFICNVM